MSIIVIGNGPSAKNWEAGEKIDGFDSVVRINRHQVEGYEKFVGIKMTHWCINTTPGVREWVELVKEFYFPVIVYIADPCGKKTTTQLLLEAKSVDFVTIPESQVLHLTEVIGMKASTGIALLYHLLQNDQEVYAHGFDILVDGNPGHYFTSGGRSGWHKPVEEKAVLQPYLDSQQLRILAP